MDDDHFPTASEIHEYTNHSMDRKIDKLYDKLKEKIIDAADKGEYYIYFYEYLPHTLINYLQKLGYDVTVNNQYNEFYYDIDWSEVG